MLSYIPSCTQPGCIMIGTISLKVSWCSASRKQSSNELLYRLPVKRLRLVNNHCVRSAFLANQHGVFQISFSLIFDSICFPNCLKACFTDVLARWIFVEQTLSGCPVFLDIAKLCEARDHGYTGSVLERDHWYKIWIKNQLELDFGVKNLRFLVATSALSVWWQVWLIQIFDSMAFLALLGELIFISFVIQFYHSAVSAIHHVRSVSYFLEAAQDRACAVCSLLRGHCCCTAISKELAQRTSRVSCSICFQWASSIACRVHYGSLSLMTDPWCKDRVLLSSLLTLYGDNAITMLLLLAATWQKLTHSQEFILSKFIRTSYRNPVHSISSTFGFAHGLPRHLRCRWIWL